MALWSNCCLREVRGIFRVFEQLLDFQQRPHWITLATQLVSRSVRRNSSSSISQGSSWCLVPELQFSVRPAADDKCAGNVGQKFVELESYQMKLSGL